MNPENAILSQLIQDDQLYYKMNLTPEHFHDPYNRKAFNIIEKMVCDGVKVDQYSLSEHLSMQQVTGLHDALPTTANWTHYYSKLQERHRQSIATDIVKSIEAQQRDGVTSAEIFQGIEEKLQDATAKSTQYSIQKLGDTLLDFVNEVERRYNTGGEIPGSTSGIPKLDDLTLGWNRRRYYIIGARPSRGKTALLLNFARHAGMHKIPCGLLSLESSIHEVDLRIISDVANIESQTLSSGYFKKSQFHNITEAAGKLHDAPIYVYDEPNMDLQTLRAQARRMVRQFGIQVLFIDYAQKVRHNTSTGKKNDSNAEVSSALKQLSRDLEIPVIAAAQLTRDTQNRRPTIADIAESSEYEKDADTVILIHHQLDDNGEVSKSWLLVDKNRDGPTSDVPVYFKKEYVRFTERIGDIYGQ